MRKSIISLILAGSFMGTAWADTVQLQEQAPDRYVVVKGDTLWGISGKFLKSPWRWPEIWQLNKEEIKNPHWIYPGDAIVLDRSGNTPKLKLLRADGSNSMTEPVIIGGVEMVSPRIRSSSLDNEAIASISPQAINPFLKQALVLDPDTFNKAPRIAAAHESRTIFSAGDTVYATGLQAKQGEVWQAFRNGKTLVDPDTKQIAGYEVQYLGEVRVDVAADLSTLRILKAKEEIGVGDRLIRASGQAFINYMPRLPSRAVAGKVISASGADAGAGTYATVVVNRGSEDGLEVGSVLFAYKKGIPVKKELETEPDRVTPPVKSANLFVYRVFPKLSYGLLLDNTLPVTIGDEVKASPAEGSK